jgi:hypothetical protein
MDFSVVPGGKCKGPSDLHPIRPSFGNAHKLLPSDATGSTAKLAKSPDRRYSPPPFLNPIDPFRSNDARSARPQRHSPRDPRGSADPHRRRRRLPELLQQRCRRAAVLLPQPVGGPRRVLVLAPLCNAHEFSAPRQQLQQQQQQLQLQPQQSRPAPRVAPRPASTVGRPDHHNNYVRTNIIIIRSEARGGSVHNQRFRRQQVSADDGVVAGAIAGRRELKLPRRMPAHLQQRPGGGGAPAQGSPHRAPARAQASRPHVNKPGWGHRWPRAPSACPVGAPAPRP